MLILKIQFSESFQSIKMKIPLVISLLFCISSVIGVNSPYYAVQEPNYAFKWEVKDDYSGQDFGQEEARKGYNTDGEYSVLLPDGRKQIVTYNVANPSAGYVADVRYEGEQRPYAHPSPSASAYPPPTSYSPKVHPSYAVPVRPAYAAVRPVPTYSATTPVSTFPIYNFRQGPAPYVPRLEPFVVKRPFAPAPTTTRRPTTTAAPPTTTTESSPVYVPGSVKKEKMKLTPKLKVRPTELVNELFYGDLSKEKFKSDKKIHE